MIYLEKIKIKKDYRNLKKNSIIKLKDITLLVGEQGCGKSTLLGLLQKHDEEYINVKISDYTIKNGINTYYFDSEKMNPRIQNIHDFSNPDGTSRGIGIGNGFMSRFKSHGETLKNYTVGAISKANDCVLFLDEPESALSLKNQFKLASEIKNGLKNNVQFIIATHCLPLIESIEEIYSLEHNKWMKSNEFIKLSKEIK
jgi:predicted ATPase